jgi:hypothetical protein
MKIKQKFNEFNKGILWVSTESLIYNIFSDYSFFYSAATQKPINIFSCFEAQFHTPQDTYDLHQT